MPSPSHYFDPVGGNWRHVTPNIVIHSCPFTRACLLNFGGRMTLIKLQTEDEGVVVFAPTPYGKESQSALKLLAGDTPNVKYLVAPDFEHHMALKGWKEAFPQALIIGPEELRAKKKKEGLDIDIVLRPQDGHKLLQGKTLAAIGFPEELVAEFDVMYLPSHQNKEILMYHKPSETLMEADAIFNTPSYEQYKDCSTNPRGFIFPNIMNKMGFEGCLQRTMLPKIYKDKSAAREAFKQLMELDIQRIIPCHGELIEFPPTEMRAKLAKLVSKL
ncbi:hypothetical protein B0I72DRAFT_133514 [Yarrowia lipolytica]|jgi:hypothetical protein|nr:hypothetical protein YALI1_C00841g [Yarrowia lipolytica]KAE8170276.1 hypothetical protein BKA90DRAFT_141102 [Yarrowia lipolytica]QNP96359.1 Hypothetical protein YALI2_C00012g [Yarrowia lipolytica]RDW35056.1 hypothetical protein B0I72DRAFT_133514 [Yarrowia lipolytica]RDW38900.1 hypothetical protein B0I73DRAFT_132922 [Yarrowia lipolytica]